MSETPLSHPIIIRAQYIKDLSFENPDPIAAFTQNLETQPNISVNIGASANNLGGGNFEVILDIRVDAKRKEQVLFISELSYAAVVGIDGIEEDKAAPHIMIEAPHLMFPYARNIISDMTRDGGFPPLLLAPVDFAALYKQQQEQQPSEAKDDSSKKSKKSK